MKLTRIFIITTLLLVAATAGVVAQAEPAAEFSVAFNSYPDTPGKLDVQIYNRSRGEESLFFTAENVNVEHYHHYELVNGSLYLLKRTGDTNGDTWMDELWRYNANLGAAGELLFSSQGLDFRVAPNESFVALRYPLPPDNFYQGVGFLDMAGGELVQEFAFEHIDEMLAPDLDSWADDSSAFWVSFKAMGPTPAIFSHIDIATWKASDYDLAGLNLSHEYALNPNTSQLLYSDHPTFFDAMSAQEFLESGDAVTLYRYDLMNGGAEEILAVSAARSFEPRWIDALTVEFYDPQGFRNDRVRYDVDSGYSEPVTGAEMSAEVVAFPQEITAEFEMAMQALTLSMVPPMLPAEFPAEAGLPPIAPYISSTGNGFYELSLDYGTDCMGAGACHYGSMLAQTNSFKIPVGSENMPFNQWISQQVILAKNIQGYFIESNCEANCSDAQIFWVYKGYEYMVGVKGAAQEAVIALANAMIENSIP
ncbi:MAG: hypothetical protein ISR60_09010 [Anaerolineales bacterium]|nr:hypothetical protein [Anaerolineales bacterium]